MKKFKVQLEDLGQDLMFFIVDENDKILDCDNFGPKIYIGGHIPISQQEIGKPCMIHYPPHINFCFLKYNVTSINEIN